MSTAEERLARLEERVDYCLNHLYSIDSKIDGIIKTQAKTIRYVLILAVIIIGALAGVKLI